MLPSARPAATPPADDVPDHDASGIADDDLAAAPLVARLDAAEEAGDVDARQLADLLGVTPGALRAALERPALLTGDQAAAVARTLGVDATTMRALRRAPSPGGAEEAPGGAPPHGRRDAVAAPRSTLALLDAVLRAVRGDAVGLALRAAVLDAAAAAARTAGRPLPPGVHALRARLATPAADREAEAPEPASNDASDGVHDAGAGESDAVSDAALVADAAALVRELQQTAPGYDGLFAPLHDDALADLLARHALVVHAAAGVPTGTRFVLTPPLFGRRRLVYSALATADQRRLAVRAALAACAAGCAGEDAPLASPAPRATARLTELVALADLVPFWQLTDLRRRGRLGWRALAGHVATLAAGLVGDWAAERCADRGMLRVLLFRLHQL